MKSGSRRKKEANRDKENGHEKYGTTPRGVRFTTVNNVLYKRNLYGQ